MGRVTTPHFFSALSNDHTTTEAKSIGFLNSDSIAKEFLAAVATQQPQKSALSNLFIVASESLRGLFSQYEFNASILWVPDAYQALAYFTHLVSRQWPDQFEGAGGYTPTPQNFVTTSNGAWVDASVKVPKTSYIGPGAVIEAGVSLAEHSHIGAGCHVGVGAKIGERTYCHPRSVVGRETQLGCDVVVFSNATIYPRVVVGDRTRIHSGACVGVDGFGYAPSPRGALKIVHLGRVVIGNDVEIGACTAIDRGTLSDTVIGNGTKIDNQVQVAHNVEIGQHAFICGQVGLAGSCKIGHQVILAGSVGVADKVHIGDGAIVGARGNVSKDLPGKQTYAGTWPVKPRQEWWRFVVGLDSIKDLRNRLKAVEKQLGLDSRPTRSKENL